ncbi:hypothetical protein ACRQ5Q_41150 (plasmid) [Bradyrhizobium sp. PMVTL-01]|uniref:hypothetical protein n=1 Tax=Bradyrhizobium sp. PMVTL-01 TaxID=3434999 RepID=UPI003F7040FB
MLSGWREWETCQVELRNAEVDMANLAQSLTQHDRDTFELADTILVGMVDQMEVGRTSPAAVEKIQSFLQARKYNRHRIRGSINAITAVIVNAQVGLHLLREQRFHLRTLGFTPTCGGANHSWAQGQRVSHSWSWNARNSLDCLLTHLPEDGGHGDGADRSGCPGPRRGWQVSGP